MKKLITILMALFIFSMSAGATIVDDMKSEVDEYNANSDAIPSPLKDMLGNEHIHIIIDMNNGSAFNLTAVTIDGKIVEFGKMEEGEEFKPTLVVSTDEGTARAIMNSTSPAQVFLDAYDRGDIEITSPSFTKTVSLSVGKFVLKVSQWLGLY
jgi:NADPH:quinone reductase-like Zn-dependent oxidoreductase